jgi:GDP-L-fucose synthase
MGYPGKLLDVSKLKSLGWSSKITVEEGVQKVYDRYFSELQ